MGGTPVKKYSGTSITLSGGLGSAGSGQSSLEMVPLLSAEGRSPRVSRVDVPNLAGLAMPIRYLCMCNTF